MSFKLNISIVDVCAFVPNDKVNPSAVRVVMPDARIARSVIDIHERLQILPAHFPFLKFRLKDVVRTDDARELKNYFRVFEPTDTAPGNEQEFVGYGICFLRPRDLWFDSLSGPLSLDDSFRNDLISSADLYPGAAAELDPIVLGDNHKAVAKILSARLRLTSGTFSRQQLVPTSDGNNLFKLRRKRGVLESAGTEVRRPLAAAIKVATRVDGESLVVRATQFDGVTPDFELRLKPPQGEPLHVKVGNSPLGSEALFNVAGSQAGHTTLDFWLYSRLYLNPPGDPYFPEQPTGTEISTEGGCCACHQFPPKPDA